jgi:hypothetical protein
MMGGKCLLLALLVLNDILVSKQRLETGFEHESWKNAKIVQLDSRRHGHGLCFAQHGNM